MEVEADASVRPDNGGVVGSGWKLWSDGSLYVDMEVETSGTCTVSAAL